MMIRPLFKADVDQLLLIENAVHIAPWTREAFAVCFETGYLGWVMEIDKRIVGYVIVSLHTDECHVLNLCVMHANQRKGIGRQLIEYALKYAKEHGGGIADLEVRRSNVRAISLYKKMHFLEIGERKEYYPSGEGREDALIFAKSLKD